MSSTIDERVVEMQFNNKQFEKNAQSTIKTLDSLNKSLDLKNASNSFKDLDKAAKSVDLSDISRSMDQITNKISIFGTIGDQVLRNLTNRAADFAIAWAKDLTIGQVQKGWSKYEAKTQAVQVIMHATGQTIDEVNTSLDDLTWYTDQTSYSFDQMIDAISKFTGAGIALEDAEKMSEGIANWAASAGVSASKAAPAFYNLSQAMSSGALRAQDWKSIELLNMNTVEFEEKAIEIAQAMVTDGRASAEMAAAFKKANPQVQGFRDSLSTGWLSKEVMVELFKAYGDRTTEFGNAAFQAAYEAKSFTDAVEAAKEAVASGWANIFEQIFGNYEEAKVFWTEVADAMIEVFSAPTTALSELLTAWHQGGGYVDFIDSIRNAWAAVKSIGEAVAETFAKVIPPLTSDHLISVTEKLENLTRKWRNFTTKIDINGLIESQSIEMLEDGGKAIQEYRREVEEAEKHNAQVDKNMQGLRETFEGIFAVFKLAGAVTSALFKIALPFTRLLVPIAKIVGSITSALGRMSSTIVDAILQSDLFNGVLSFLEGVANKVADALTWVADKVGVFVGKLTKLPVVEKLVELLNSFYATIKEFAKPYIDNATKKLDEFVSMIDTYISQNADSFFAKASKALGEFADAAMSAANAALTWLGPALDSVWKYCKTLWQNLKSLGKWISSFWTETVAPSEAFQWLSGAMGTFSAKVKYFADTLANYIREGGLTAAFQWLRGQFNEFIWQLRHLDLGKLIGEVISLSAVIKVVSLVLTVLKVTKALRSFGKFMDTFPNTLSKFTKGLGVKRIATSILMLAGALFLLAQIDAADLKKAGTAMAIMGVYLVAFALTLSAVEGLLAKKDLSNAKGTRSAILSMIVISLSALILANALKKIADIGEWPKIQNALVALFAIVVILIAGSAVLSMGGNSLLQAGIGLLAIVGAIILIVYSMDKIKEALKDFKLDTFTIGDDIAMTAGVLVGIAAAVLLASLVVRQISKNLWQVAAIILSIGATIFLIALAVQQLAKIDKGALGRAALILIGLIGAMIALGYIAKLFKAGDAKGILGMAAAIFAIGAAIGTIVGALILLTWIGPQAEYALGVLGGIMLMMSIVLLAASRIKPQTGGAIFGMAALVLAIVGALVILAHQDFSKIFTSVMMLGLTLLVLGKALTLTGAALSGGKLGNILGIAGIIVVITAALLLLARVDAGNLMGAALSLAMTVYAFAYGMKIASAAMAGVKVGQLVATISSFVAISLMLLALANMPAKQVLAAAIGMSTVMITLALAMSIIKSQGSQTDSEQMLGNLVFAVGAMVTIAVVLAILARQDPQRLLASVIAMAGVLLTLAFVMPIISRMKAPSVGDGIKIAFFIAAVLAPIALALGILASTNIDAGRMVAMATAMAEVMIALAAPVAAIALIGKLGAGESFMGSLAFVGIIAVLMAAMVGIGELVTWAKDNGTDILADMEVAKEVMVSIGAALGGLIGGLVAGFGDVVFDSLANWGNDIKTFLGGIKEGIAEINTIEIDEGKMAGLESFGKAILALTAAEILDGIARFIGQGTDLATFAGQVGAMGPALKRFAEDTAGVDGDTVKPAAEAIEALSNVARNLGRTGGLIERAIGKPITLGQFASEMDTAADKLNSFAQKMNEKDSIAYHDDKVKAAAGAIQAMSDVAQSLGRSGGWIDDILGKPTTLGEFAQQMKDIIPNLSDFANAAPQIADKEQDIRDVAGAIQAMVTVANALLPKTESNFWSGRTTEAQSLGDFFSAFSDSGFEAGLQIGDFKIGANLSGKKGITSSLKEFAAEMSTLDMDGMEKGKTAITKLVGIAELFKTNQDSISVLGGLVYSRESGETSGIENLAAVLESIGPRFVNFSSAIADMDIASFATFSAAVLDLAAAETRLDNLQTGGSLLKGFATELQTSAINFKDAASALEGANYQNLEDFFTWMNDNYSVITGKGVEAVGALYTEMQSQAILGGPMTADIIVGSLVTLMKSDSNNTKYKDAGRFLVDGFVQGIRENIYKGQSIAWQLSEATIQAMRRALRIASPSRVMQKLGGFTGEGFVKGLASWIDPAANTSDDLANSVAESAEATLGYLSQLLNGELVVSMTIRPVLDLTDVQSGAMAIDSMFTQRQAIAAQLDANALSQSDEIAELVDVSWKILREIQNGREIYLDGNVLAGSMNRRLGALTDYGRMAKI